MGKLRDAGLVEVTKVGIWAYYRLIQSSRAEERALSTPGLRAMSRVLFVCKQNAGRSQMSDALFQPRGAGPARVSLGGHPLREHVHPSSPRRCANRDRDFGQPPQMLTRLIAQLTFRQLNLDRRDRSGSSRLWTRF